MMRLFVAIKLPALLRDNLCRQLDILKKEINTGLKWVEKDHYHITLRFLGEVKGDKIFDIKKAIDIVAQGTPIAPLLFKGSGAFPYPDYPKIFYLRVKKGENYLKIIHHKLEDELVKIGFKREDRSYTPHITLARSRRNTDMKRLSCDIKGLMNREFFVGEMTLEKISLIKSELKSDGPVYQDIYSVSL
ncbi:MAG: RNA 2',3'-cyclic phosphodiesterase [Firmicutes bacterium]|nr:RNA 2',3'-cyclic phosphodiesterase [Bacillota bacterium]